MVTFIVLTKLNATGLRTIRDNAPGQLQSIRDQVATLDGKVVSQFGLVGPYDFMSIIEAPDNAAAMRIAAERGTAGRGKTTVLPAIDLDLFTRLLGQSTETTGPYKWQIRWWAQIARRALRYYTITRHARRYFKPFEVEGREHLKDLKGPAIFIANHSSHFDSIALIQALPERFRRRATFGGAADRWFLKGRKGMQKQGWWNSLAMNTWPIKRGGGRSSLEYGEWLLDKGWSVVIFPEGTRSTTGKMAHFKHGVALMALAKEVPVVPLYLEGLREIRPKGSLAQQPGPVRGAFGPPIRFAPGTAVPDATRTMYHAMEELRLRLHRPRRDAAERPAEAMSEAATGGG